MDKKLIGMVIFGLAILSIGLLANAPKASAAGEAKLDFVFCIDTTGSMSGEISDVKDDAEAIIDVIMDDVPDSRIGVLGYRDFGDSYLSTGYSYTSSEDTAKSNINALSAGGGGDTPEAVYEALMDIINEDEVGSWRSGATRVIMLMGDHAPHEDEDGDDYEYTADEVISAAKAKDVIICAVVVEDYGMDALAQEKFEELAKGTGCTLYEVEETEDVSETVKVVAKEAVEKAEDDADDDVEFDCCFLDWISGSATRISGFFGRIF